MFEPVLTGYSFTCSILVECQHVDSDRFGLWSFGLLFLRVLRYYVHVSCTALGAVSCFLSVLLLLNPGCYRWQACSQYQYIIATRSVIRPRCRHRRHFVRIFLCGLVSSSNTRLASHVDFPVVPVDLLHLLMGGVLHPYIAYQLWETHRYNGTTLPAHDNNDRRGSPGPYFLPF